MNRFNRERAAVVLAEAALTTDSVAAERHGVSVRTVQRWRAQLDRDPDLAAIVAVKKADLERAWVGAATESLRRAAEFLGRAAEEMSPTNPEHVHAVAGAFKLLSEALLARDVIDARLAGAHRRHDAAAGTVVPIDAARRTA
ncbi:MAG: helix-turn-helix domain-containing protein [Micromonosporaceae bacterium]|nr:helix-turn-helix domain-containing protein [Micromonosporaceae bacterium]